LPQEATAQLVRNLPSFEDPNLIVGTEGFSDAGVYRLRDDLYIVQSLDFFPPLVDNPFEFGQIAAANSLSDVYTMGGQPTTVLNIVGFPDDQLEMDVLAEILQGGSERVKLAGAVVVGGHTVRDVEIKYGLSVTGIVTPDKLITNRHARAGDLLVLTKPLGTGFVTTAFKAGRCPPDVISAAVDSMRQLNVVGRDAALEFGAHAATDITGFGLAGHAGEMAQASHVTIALEIGRLPTLPGAEELARRGSKTRASATNRRFAEPHMRIEGHPDETRLEFAFDAQTSGGMLISVEESRGDELVQRVRDQGGQAACVVGQVLPQQDVALIIRA
jgi:selenide,water dikinase